MLKRKLSVISIGLLTFISGVSYGETIKETVVVTQPAQPTTQRVIVTPTTTTTSEGVIVTQPATQSIVTTAPATTTKEVTVTNPNTNTTTTTTTTKQVLPATPQQVIVTPAPHAKEVVVIPSGYADCFTVASGWFSNEWIPEHKICQYKNAPEGVAWVEGYWACTEYKTSEGSCTNWDWRSGHWTKTLPVY